MIEIDCLGDMCPIPAIRLETELNRLGKGEEIMLVTDHSCVPVSLEKICKMRGVSFRADEVINGVWEIFIST